MIEIINNHVSAGALYKALKEIRKLMKVEEEPAIQVPAQAQAFMRQ